mmetsp:Transcript_24642/g.29003  ORF Transcript_24642/g.29003 Transcript_24642/m.29003 type:complete len:406 (-) Transcript_24642:304-1521(-)
MTPLVVAFTHRRIVDFAGGSQSEIYSSVISNAEKCGGLVQLGPLDMNDREDYLRQSLKVAKVPPEISNWVSDVANGNPQYIEICAKEVDKPEIMIREPQSQLGTSDDSAEVPPPIALMVEETGVQALNALEKPRKIVGFIKQVLGSLGPQDKLLMQILSLFNDSDETLPLPSMGILIRAFESIAQITYERLERVLERLVLYGLLEAHMRSVAPPNIPIITTPKSPTKPKLSTSFLFDSINTMNDGDELITTASDHFKPMERKPLASSPDTTDTSMTQAEQKKESQPQDMILSVEPVEPQDSPPSHALSNERDPDPDLSRQIHMLEVEHSPEEVALGNAIASMIIVDTPKESKAQKGQKGHHVLFYKISFPLLQQMAAETLLGHQKAPILAAITGKPISTSRTSSS